MAYYTKVLLPDEQVRHIGRLHWWIYVRAWTWFVLAVAAGIAASHLRSPGMSPGISQQAATASGQPPDAGGGFYFAAAASGIFLILWLLGLLGAWLRRITTEIVVTDRRIIFKEGLVRRRTLEMNMNKVETVDVIQSIWGRLLNYGTVIIRGVGSSYEPLNGIAEPLALRTAIVAQ